MPLLPTAFKDLTICNSADAQAEAVARMERGDSIAEVLLTATGKRDVGRLS